MFKMLKAFVRKEMVQVLRDPRMKLLLIMAPMVQMTVFGLALNSDETNIKLYARPMANDPLFRDIRRDAIASAWFIEGARSELEVGESIQKFKRGQLDAALYAPQGGLTQAFERGEGRLEAVIDGTDLIRARAVQSYLQAIVSNDVSNRLGKPNSYDFAAWAQTKPAETSWMPIEFATRILYNPELVSAYALVPGVLSMIVCIITIMMTSMSIAKEKEIGTFETLIAAPVTTTEIILGKTVPYMIIGAINLPLIFAVAVLGFDVPMRGSYIWLTVASVFFIITTVSIGTMISIFSKSQQQAMMGSFIFLMPAILLSGIIFPIANLPLLFKIAAYLNPLMYYSVLLRNIMLKGGDYFVLATYTGALLLIAVLSSSAAFKRFRLRLG